MELRESERLRKKPSLEKRSELDKAGTIPMSWRRGERWSPVTRVSVFIACRSLRIRPGVSEAIVVLCCELSVCVWEREMLLYRAVCVCVF